MKTLEEYIKEITEYKNIKYDYIDNIIYEHIYIHYLFSNKKLNTEQNIYESSTGIFPKEHDIIKFILNKLEDCSKDTYIINLKQFGFIENLYIHFDTNNESSISGEYVIDNEKYSDYNIVRWDSENKIFRFCEIKIYNYDKNPDLLEEILYHEVKHIWDDYQYIKNKKQFLSDKVKKSLSNKFNKLHINQTIKDIIYYSEDYEISAYIAQLNKVLGNKKFNSVKEAFNEIIKDPIYINLKFVYQSLNNDDYKEQIILQDISEQRYNKLKKNFNKKWKQILHHIYNICVEYISENRLSPSFNSKNIKLIK